MVIRHRSLKVRFVPPWPARRPAPIRLRVRNLHVVKMLLRWIKINNLMLTNAGALVGTTMVTSILGSAYWWVAARRFLPEAVGVASASVSAMVLLGGFCVLGFGTLLITELPRQPGQAA